MKTLMLLIFSCVFTSSVFAQSFDEKNIDQNRLESLILQKLNQHRNELNLSSLYSEIYLQKAAALHSRYQVDNNILTHNQNNKKFASPHKRVLACGGTNGLVGENVAYVSLKKTYKEMAEDFYQGWKNSPPHYQNMIHPDFRYSGIRFQANADGSLIYGTHVFGGEMYIPPPVANFPIGAYGVKDYDEKICRRSDNQNFLSEAFASWLDLKGDSIFISYHDINYFEQQIINEFDGLAIDIIERRQFPCATLNRLHGSGIHMGVMLPPVFKEDIFKNNRSKDPNSINTFLGILPQGIEAHHALNIILIQDSCACRNGAGINVPQLSLPLFHINPIWAFAELKQNNYVDTILPFLSEEVWTNVETKTSIQEETKTFFIDFDKNEFQFKNTPNALNDFLIKNKKQIKNIKIQAFSSVEGSTDRNLFLQKKRTEIIAKEIKSKGIPVSKIQKISKENWELFFGQILNTEWEEWKNEEKAKVKSLLKNKTIANKIEPFLAAQRVANITITFDNEVQESNYSTIYFDGVKTVNEVKPLIGKFIQLIDANKMDSALLVQYDLIQQFLQKKVSINDITDIEIPIEISNLPLLSNQLAVELFFKEGVRTDKAFIKKVKELAQLDKDYLPMKFNLTGFATRYLYLMRDTIMDAIDLEFAISDLLDDEDYLITYLNPTQTIERLQVNFHLAVVSYYLKNRFYSLRSESLEFVKDYFVNQGMTELETIQLAQYFNYQYRFKWAIELLLPFVEKGNCDENTLFTFVETIALFMDKNEKDKQLFLKYSRVAQKRNSTRFCNWINSAFQLLSENDVKKMYCKTCE